MSKLEPRGSALSDGNILAGAKTGETAGRVFCDGLFLFEILMLTSQKAEVYFATIATVNMLRYYICTLLYFITVFT